MTKRLVFAFLALTVVVLAVLIVPLGVSNQRRQLDDVRSGLERDAFVLASFTEGNVDGRVLSPAAADRVRRYADDVGARVVVVDADGMALIDSDPPEPGERSFASRPEVAAALAGEISTGTRRSDTLDTDLVYAAVPVASGGLVTGAVRVTYPTAEVDRRVRRYWLALAGVGVVSALVVAVLGVLLARSVTKPLRQIEDAARDIGRGDLSRRVPDDRGPPEVRSLARGFNRTAARLEVLVASQEAFVADASHQLRTPLTGLRLQLENLTDDVQGDGAEDLQDAVEEVDRLARMVDGLLVLARAEQPNASTTARRLEVDAVLEDRASIWRPLAEEKGVTIRTDGAGAATVTADPDRLVQVLDNLVANALDASPSGSEVRLLGEGRGDRTALHVVDQGVGLSELERDHAFDRFWRADPSRDGLGGSGLGLSIVAKLIAVDGGSVRLDAASPNGVDAIVELPA